MPDRHGASPRVVVWLAWAGAPDRDRRQLRFRQDHPRGNGGRPAWRAAHRARQPLPPTGLDADPDAAVPGCCGRGPGPRGRRSRWLGRLWQLCRRAHAGVGQGGHGGLAGPIPASGHGKGRASHHPATPARRRAVERQPGVGPHGPGAARSGAQHRAMDVGGRPSLPQLVRADARRPGWAERAVTGWTPPPRSSAGSPASRSEAGPRPSDLSLRTGPGRRAGGGPLSPGSRAGPASGWGDAASTWSWTRSGGSARG